MNDNFINNKRYYVDFYDMIDGWGEFGFFSDRLFDDLGEAKILCDKLNSELDQSNKDCGEHFGIIDKEISREIYCGMDEKYKIQLAESIKIIRKKLRMEEIKSEGIEGIDWSILEEHWNKEYEDDFVKNKK